jgi:predicted ester cyclase
MYKPLREFDPESARDTESSWAKSKGAASCLAIGLLVLTLSVQIGLLAHHFSASSLSSCNSTSHVVVDTVGGPGSPLAKQVVVGMDTNVNLHRAFNQWEAWYDEMEPYWTADAIYDFNYVGVWGFGATHGLREWYEGEHLHFNAAMPDSQWTDFIRAATNTTCTSASYGLARWAAPFAGVPPPKHKPWVRIPDLDFYLIQGDRIKINWCIVDIVAVFQQCGYEVLPPAPMKTEGYKAPNSMDGFPAPLSASVNPEDTAKSNALWSAAVKEDYLLNVGGARHWAENMIWYGPGGIGTAHSRSEYRKHFLEPLHGAFSDMEMHMDLQLCEGKYCGAHFIMFGTHIGEWLGEKPTGKRIPIRCGAHAHFENGKIVEGWLIIDVPRAFAAMGVDLYARANASAHVKGLV